MEACLLLLGKDKQEYRLYFEAFWFTSEAPGATNFKSLAEGASYLGLAKIFVRFLLWRTKTLL